MYYCIRLNRVSYGSQKDGIANSEYTRSRTGVNRHAHQGPGNAEPTIMICLTTNASRRRRTALDGAHIKFSTSIHMALSRRMGAAAGRWPMGMAWRRVQGASSVKRPPIRRCTHQARETPPYRNSNRDSTSKGRRYTRQSTQIRSAGGSPRGSPRGSEASERWSPSTGVV